MQKSALFLCALVVLGLVGTSEGQPGSKIAFISGRGSDELLGQYIWIMEADGSNPTQLSDEGAALTKSETESIGFEWSPDGMKIAFESFRDAPRAIWIAEADGSNPVNLTGNTNNACTHPSWSPDGTKIAFESSRDIWIMEADGTNWVNLTPDVGLDGGPDFSPDGTKIAFRSFRGGKTDIYLIGVDGTNLVNLTGGEGNNREADWSPDGTKIAFQSNRSGRFQIWVMDVDGSNPVQLTGGQGGANLPHWSPNGTKIVYAEVSSSFTGTSIRSMDADGENKVDIVNRIGGLTVDVPLDWSAGLERETAIEATSWGQVKKGK